MVDQDRDKWHTTITRRPYIATWTKKDESLWEESETVTKIQGYIYSMYTPEGVICQ